MSKDGSISMSVKVLLHKAFLTILKTGEKSPPKVDFAA
jgi:hypothetical protein